VASHFKKSKKKKKLTTSEIKVLIEKIKQEKDWNGHRNETDIE
jgi:hypothetical protein